MTEPEACPPGFFAAAIQGARPYQEDSHDILAECQGAGSHLLMLLADGMGGHVGGATASALAVAQFKSAWRQSFPEEEPRQRLERALHAANQALAQKVQADPMLTGMGCTLVGAVISGRALHWISVGDSPLWLMQEGRLQRLNADHSMAPLLQNLVKEKLMSAEEAAVDPRRNALRSVLMGEELPLVDCPEPLALLDSALVLLASDGLQTLTDAAIADVLRQSQALSPETCVSRLLEALEHEQHPGQDNTTVMVYSVPVGGDAALPT